VVALWSSDTEETLELLLLSSPRGPASRVSEPSFGFGSDQFKDWPKANDATLSVYVSLTVDVSRSRTSPLNDPHVDQESHSNISSTRRSRSWLTSSQKPHRQKLWLLVLREGNPRKRILTVDALLWCPRHAVVHLLPLILIGSNGKSCTLFLSKKSSLILLNV
jgi:hypothetical protein